MHKDNGIDAAVMAAFLRTGRQLDQASMLLLLVAIALAIGARGPALAMLLGLNLAAAGIAKYYALRVALDADLFAVLARHPERIAQWDAALAFCTGRTESARSLAERWAGARRLQQRQIAALTVQLLLLTVCAI
ncbi:MAG: hypothetical protein WKG03_09110 [Telluria sp.]